MKKSALLAVSALSLGLVGLSTFVPVANAAYSTSNEATITATVTEAFGIGSAEIKDADSTVWTGEDVTFPAIGTNAVAEEQAKTIYTVNNSGKPATLTVKSQSESAALESKNGTITNTIATGTDIAKGSSNWGIKFDGAYHAMPGSGATALAIGKNASNSGQTDETSKKFDVTYGLSTSSTRNPPEWR